MTNPALSPATPDNFTVTQNPQRVSDAEVATILDNPGFGNYFTDHMVLIDWTKDHGWHDPRVVPYAPLSMDPASSVLHYGQAIFEGLKAYRHADGSIKTFRPDRNAARLNDSAARLAMPDLPAELFHASLEQLIAVDHRWVPAAGGEECLYIRPFMISREVGLGVHPADSYTFCVIASPAGAYFSGGINPVSVWLAHDYVRAVRGGTGAAKFAGNYAASLLAQAYALEQGCDQVVWLDAIEHKYVEEMGGMNLFFVFGEGENVSIVTPKLTGSLLPGVTRATLLEIAADMGYSVEERLISTEEWHSAAASGELSETFACGTAAVVTPVGTVKSVQGEFQVNEGRTGSVTMRLREHLTGIQRGTVEDTRGWLKTLKEG